MVALRNAACGSPATWRRCWTAWSADRPLRVLTPRDPQRRGAQLSVRIGRGPAPRVCDRLRREHGVIADAREPDVVRLAPVPLYCTHHDAWRAAKALVTVVGG